MAKAESIIAFGELDCPGAVMTLARYYAKNAVKAELAARGVKVQSVEFSELQQLTRRYVEEHWTELAERAMNAVRNNPQIRTLAEREARRRRRNRR
jgi:hypothetical protein